MKKLIMVLAISLFAMALVCAADTIELSNNGTETVTIKLDTTAITGSTVAVGFSTEAVTTFEQNLSSAHPDEEILLTLGSDRVATAALTTEDTKNGAYHVYWKIASENTVEVTLAVTDLTKSADGTGPSSIPLSLTVGEYTLESAGSSVAGGNNKTFKVINTTTATGTTVGSYELKNIKTDAINETSSGTYTATLTLSVSIT